MSNTRGQNTIEYVLLVAAVLLVCIFMYNFSGGSMSSSVNASLFSIVNDVNNLNSQIQFSGGAPTSSVPTGGGGGGGGSPAPSAL